MPTFKLIVQDPETHKLRQTEIISDHRPRPHDPFPWVYMDKHDNRTHVSCIVRAAFQVSPTHKENS